ncbi:MAG: Chemotaxis protein CheA [Firmicutes bacterium ADurb.Bin419]|nr:MAG: Chemotaxis protein CheA [Firmicutes bacterium ADurb.Bin419]
MIFIDEITTAQVVDELSGRGIGLSTVRNEVHKLKGNIEFNTSEGAGMEFKITIPLY